jgi:hypothetical protein
MTDLQHAVSFFQNAYTIILALALTEGLKQFVADGGERNIFWNKLPSLVGFLFLIFPFFHGMSRYLYSSYLAPGLTVGSFAGHLMFDGIMFMLMSACFFIMSRSLSPDRWKRYYGALACVLVVDSAWVLVVLSRGAQVSVWLELDIVVAYVMLVMFLTHEKHEETIWPPLAAMATIIFTTIVSYFLMQDFYFLQH